MIFTSLISCHRQKLVYRQTMLNRSEEGETNCIMLKQFISFPRDHIPRRCYTGNSNSGNQHSSQIQIYFRYAHYFVNAYYVKFWRVLCIVVCFLVSKDEFSLCLCRTNLDHFLSSWCQGLSLLCILALG